MARRKKKRTNRNSRARKVNQGKKLLRDEKQDNVVISGLQDLFNEKEQVLNATDLNESFKFFAHKNGLKAEEKRK